MKRMLTIALACCALVLALVGCSESGTGSSASSSASSNAESGASPSAAANSGEEGLKGYWVLESADDLGFDASLSLSDENVAELLIYDSFLDGTWSSDGSSAHIDYDDGGSANISLQDGKLIYGSESGSKLVFVKSDAEAAEAAVLASEGSELDALGSDEAIELGDFEDVEIVDEVIEDIKPVSIAEDDNIKIEVTGKGTDFTGDPGYRLKITNNGSKAIFIVPKDEFTIDGKSIEAGLGEVVDPGEELEAFLYFSAEELGGGADKLVKVEGELTIGDDDTSEEIKSYKFKMD